MVDKAIKNLTDNYPKFKVYSISIWTDPNAAVSAINFDTKTNSKKVVQKLNKFFKKRYDESIKEGDLEMAELYKPSTNRNCNPANFKLRNFEKVIHLSIPRHWESETEGKCWKQLKPALNKVGIYAFKKSLSLSLDDDFELRVNSDKDWYDKKWTLK